MSAVLAIALASFAAWLYLLAGRGLFWLARERDGRGESKPPVCWPAVTAVVPARNEADVIEQAVSSLLQQDYPGRFDVILVDDGSNDGTADRALAAAQRSAANDRLRVIQGRPPPNGWTGKLWAMAQGLDAAKMATPDAAYVLLTDADIAHQPDVLRGLVSRAEAGGLSLASLMVKLRVDTPAERWLIPAFVFFFDMLFPFAWVNDPKRGVAAAAGGCMLVRRQALEAGGGVAAVRGEIIDDCALGAQLKKQGPIWLGLTDKSHSLRPYGSLADVWRMIARSAYAQLGYSLFNLLGAVLGMGLVFVAPPLLFALATGPARWLGLAAWLMMTLAYQPMLRFYRLSPLYGFGLPAIGALYTACTVDSALQVWRGRGGQWKGRAQAMAGSS